MKNADIYGIIVYSPGHSFSLYGGSVESMYYLPVPVFCPVFLLMYYFPFSCPRFLIKKQNANLNTHANHKKIC